MFGKLQDFFSNGGYATWFQSLFVVASVGVALYSIKDTDTNATVSNAVNLAQKYYTEKPTLANAALRLRISQYEQVQQAKKTLVGYDPKNDPDFDGLFKVARPLVAKTISEDNSPNGLQDAYNSLNDFFSAIFVCVINLGCDRTTSVRWLGDEILYFYNAACPYMETITQQHRFDPDSNRYIAFLVGTVGYKVPSKYFCRDELRRYLTAPR